jgi:hypothetical protein
MKKLIFSAAVLASAFFAASCQQELLDPVQGGSTVTFSVEIPEVAGTKATIGDEPTSINDLVYAVYRTTASDLETTLSNWDEYASLVYQKNPSTQVFTDNYTTTVSLELINNQNYVILFWAQKNDVWVAGEDFDLTNITYPADSEGNVNMVVNRGVADKYAAFSAVRFLGANEFAGQKTVELTRPFAQINIAAKDPVNYNVVVKSASMTVRSAGDSFNVASQSAPETKESLTYTWENIPATDGFVAGGVTYDHYVAMGYVFANDNVSVSYEINTASHGTVANATTPINNVPVAANYRTNIVGNILTSDVDYEVTLVKDWSTPDNTVEVKTVSTAQELVDAFDELTNNVAGETTNIKLDGDINLEDLFAPSTQAVTKAGNATLPIVIPAGTFTLDLNGFIISTPLKSGSTTDHYYAFENHGTLTIVDSKGTGSLNARGNFNYGKMTLESGTINAIDGNGGYGVLNYEGAEFVMNGGSIMTSYEDDHQVDKGGIDATTMRVDEGATATINGGTINNICDFTHAIDNRGTVTVNGGEFNSVHSTVSTDGTMTINDGSFICDGIQGVSAHCLVAWEGSQTTINGGIFNGKDNYNGFNVDAVTGATVYIKGGEFLQVHSGSLYGEGTIIVTGGTFFDQVPAKYLAAGYSCQQNEEGKWIVPQVALAKIGDDSYPTLAAAIEDVEDGVPTTITVQAAIFTDESIVIPAGKSITLDLNGMSITAAGEEGYAITNMGELKIKNNGVINGVVYAEGTAAKTIIEGGTYNALENAQYVLLNSQGASLTINAATINGGSSYPIYSYDDNSKLVINDATVNATFGCVNSYGTKGSVEINGGTFKMTGVQGKTSHIAYFSRNCTANINGGTFEKIGNISMSGTGGGGICVNGGADLTINGGSFAGDYADVYNWGKTGSNTTIAITGGTYKFKPDFLADGYKAVQTNGVYNVVVDPVAKIGETEYATLKEAFSVGGNVTLLRDVTITEPATLAGGKTAVLDLNGKTLTAELVSALVSTEGSDLTVKNGKVVAYESTVRAIGGKVTVESGEYTSTGSAVGSPSTNRYSLDCREGGELIINGGTFKSNNGMLNVGSTVTINGGKFENIVEKVTTRHFAYVSALLTVNDGEFIGKANAGAGGCFFCGAGANGDIQVNGGKFTSLWTNGNINRIFEVYFGGTINVTGGLFNTNGGITNFVVANTDETTKGAYPYVAK